MPGRSPSEETPLYSALIREAARKTIRMHMPGHKGKTPVNFDAEKIFEIDFTELPNTGNLYLGIPPISDAEALMAQVVGAKECYYLTGGSTQGVMTAISTVCPLGSTIITDRGNHRSVWSIMAHLDLVPEYLYANRIEPYGITAPITPAELEAAIKKAPQASAVIITSPTFYGIISDIKAISSICKRYGVPLIVDEAHGAHLPFIGYPSAVALGATLALTSTHKTLPSFTAGALLFSDGSYDTRDIRRKSALFGTSSPSYTVMASMDTARAYLEGEGGVLYKKIIEEVNEMRREINNRGVFRAMTEEDGYDLDPARLTINTALGGITGYQAEKILDLKYNIVCEMADERNIVMIITSSDTKDELECIKKAIMDMEKTAKTNATISQTMDFPLPIIKLTPREAAYADKEYLILKDAIGRIAGEHLSPYPPGIPIVASGEVIGEEHLKYLEYKCYNTDREVAVIK